MRISGLSIFVCIFIIFGLSGCGGISKPNASAVKPVSTGPKSAKRGIAYDIHTDADMAVLAPGVSWWYNWGRAPYSGLPSNYTNLYGMEYVPMLWNQNFPPSSIESFIMEHPEVKYLMVMNEPNLKDQANRTPSQAASDWLRYEQVLADLSNQGRTVYLVGPQTSYGTMNGYWDPEVWMDDFYSNYQVRNNGRSPHIDYIGVHCYDYGLSGMIQKLSKYGKPFWVTEMANWHQNSVDTTELQEASMSNDFVMFCETNKSIFRYSWFTGRMPWPDVHHSTLLSSTNGVLTPTGKYYLNMPYTVTNRP